MMKRYVATVRVELEAESIESRDVVIERMVEKLNKKPPSVWYDDAGGAWIRKASVSRVRPHRRRK